MADLPPPPPPGSSSLPPPPPPGPLGYGTSGPVAGARASFGSRLGALILDGIIVTLFFVPAVVAVATGPTELEPCTVDAQGEVDPFGSEDNALCEEPTGATWALGGVLFLAGLVGAVLYHTLLVGRTGQTLGARATRIRVVDATTGSPIGAGRALGRFLFQMFISGSVCYLGYLWMLWDDNKQTWHDKVVGSVVVPA